MRKRFTLTNSICRLLTLLLILPLCSVQAFDLQRIPIDSFSSLPFNSTNPEYGDNSIYKQSSMAYTVWNRCSKHFMRIRGPGRKGVDAKGDKGANDTTLIFEVIGANGLTSIKGEESNLYLCMTKKGKLRARHKFTADCGFIRIIENGYDRFQLKLNPLWYVGFRKARRRKLKSMGKPLPAFKRTAKLARCYEFLAQPIDGYPPQPSVERKSPVIIPNWYDPEPKSRIRTSYKHRHSKHRNKNGRRRGRRRRGRRRQRSNINR